MSQIKCPIHVDDLDDVVDDLDGDGDVVDDLDGVDRDDGEVESDFQANELSEIHDAIGKNLSHSWDGFKFAFVRRRRKSGPRQGQEYCQWEVTCKLHRDGKA